MFIKIEKVIFWFLIILAIIIVVIPIAYIAIIMPKNTNDTVISATPTEIVTVVPSPTIVATVTATPTPIPTLIPTIYPTPPPPSNNLQRIVAIVEYMGPEPKKPGSFTGATLNYTPYKPTDYFGAGDAPTSVVINQEIWKAIEVGDMVDFTMEPPVGNIRSHVVASVTVIKKANA